MRQAAAVREHKHAAFAPLASLLVCGLLGCHAYDADLIDLHRPQSAASAVTAAGSGGIGALSAGLGGTGRANAGGGAIAVAGAVAVGSSGAPSSAASAGRAGQASAPQPAGASASAGTYGGASQASAEPARCGDGMVQTDLGETCDPGKNEFAPACPSEADCDDSDVCTRDTLKGSAATCDAACEHTALTSSLMADGCCPSGANATTDIDCAARCGNGVREGSEQCDGEAGCDSSCKLTSTADQQCLGVLASNDCNTCQCTYCAAAALACSASGNSSRDAACTSVETCAAKNNCAGQACYCGDSSPTSLACSLAPNGACVREVEAAAGSGLALVIDAQYNDPSTALGRARTLGECRRQNCAAACSAP